LWSFQLLPIADVLRDIGRIAGHNDNAPQPVSACRLLGPFAPAGAIVAAARGALGRLAVGIALAALSTALAHVVFHKILTVSGPQNAMLVTLLIPVFGLAFGITVLGETLLLGHVAGASIITLSLLVIDGRIPRFRRRTR
jgi:drug/metabolite transporter (DMT)-like permease